MPPGPGRPKGSKDRETLETEVLMNTVCATVTLINEALPPASKLLSPAGLLLMWSNDVRIDRQTRIQCAEIIMPYSHRKKPVEIESSERG
jgi:hypothetical protein